MTTTARTVRIETTPFTRSHMREPRGFGSWAFAFGSERAEPWFVQGTFVEARRAARAEAERRGSRIAFVLP